MMTTGTVLIVEDEKDIRDLLVFNLKREGFAVLEAGDGKSALEVMAAKKPDIVLLDLMLPGMDGLSVSKAMQKDAAIASIPVIMLTAKGEEVDRIVGLELGASDYVVKPFSVREVILRIRAVLRRGIPSVDTAVLECGPVIMNTSGHTVHLGDVPVDLTVTEFRLLEDMIRHAGAVRSREQLLDSVWGYSFEGYARTVDTHVRRLRAKLGTAADIIETVRGVGYRAKKDV